LPPINRQHSCLQPTSSTVQTEVFTDAHNNSFQYNSTMSSHSLCANHDTDTSVEAQCYVLVLSAFSYNLNKLKTRQKRERVKRYKVRLYSYWLFDSFWPSAVAHSAITYNWLPTNWIVQIAEYAGCRFIV
jgi:hypothetical protein